MFKLPLSGEARNWFVVIAMCICAFSVSYTTTATLNSLPLLSHDLGMSPNALQWILSSYSLATGTFIIIAGQLGDRFNYRRAFYIGVVIFALASVLITFAASGPAIIAGRTIQGLGAAFITPLSLSLIKFNFEGERAKNAIAIWAATVALGFSMGPILGGILTALFSWRAIFWFSLIIVIIGTVLLLITPGKPKTTNVNDNKKIIPLDFIGLVLLIVGLVPLLLGLSEGNAWGWDSPLTWACILVGAALLVIFFFVERRRPHPLIHFHHFKQRLFVAALIGQACTIILIVTLLSYFNLYAQTPSLLGYTSVQAGLAILPMSLLVFFISFIAPCLVKRYGYHYLMSLSFIMAAIGFYLLHNTLLLASYTAIWPALVLIGLGVGMLFASFSGLAMTSFAPEEAGQASGILGTDMYVASSIGIAVSMIFFLRAGRDTVQQSLHALPDLTEQSKLLIDQALVQHTLPLQQLLTQFSPAASEQITKIASLASLHSFHAAMLYATVIAIVGAISCGFLIKKNE